MADKHPGSPGHGTVTQISSRTQSFILRALHAADVRELDAVVDAVVRGVGPDDGPDLADAGFEHSARHDTRNGRSGCCCLLVLIQ